MTQSSHKPGLNAPSYSNPEDITHKFEKDINGRMLAVMRTYSMKAARAAKAAQELLETLEVIEKWMSGYGTKTQSEMREVARAAIAKAGL